MFRQLLFVEWARLTRRALLWLALAAVVLYAAYSHQHYYTSNTAQLRNGDLAMPGFSFDLATPLDHALLVIQPLLIIITAVLAGSDYSQRTNLHWLMRVSRPTSLLAKFALLALVTVLTYALTLGIGGGIGWYFKNYIFQNFSLENVNWAATAAAPFYMSLVTLPYLAFALLITIATRSTFAGIVIGLGYTQFMEILLTGLFYGAGWAQWLMRNLYFSATYLLNSIGNRVVETPARLLEPSPAFAVAVVYTALFLALAIRLYNRQDVGG
ncbi:MAG: hypothetical protein KDE29_10815 [Anaerolineales bacterium]|nr:hypothetical protein [Anaerolineales bacterium]